MSVTKLARAVRIDNEANRLEKQANTINSQLSALVNEVNAFATFAQADPNLEVTQEDKDKYSALFVGALANIQTTLAGFDSLYSLETDVITVEQFIAQSESNPIIYSSRFDKG